MTTDKKMVVELENVGPHSLLSLEFRPGLNVLCGQNGAGKSAAVAAMVEAGGGAASGGLASVSKKDGAPPGKVSVDGAVVLKIGAKLTHAGKPSVEMGGYSEVSTIVDPGIKDPEKADAARIKAILRMVQVPVTKEVRAKLSGGVDDLAPDAASVMECAEQVRVRANRLALEAEQGYQAKMAEAKQCEARGVAARGGVVHGVQPMPAKNAVELEWKARADLGKTQALHGQRKRHEEQVAQLRVGFGERPPVDEARVAVTAAEKAAYDALVTMEEAKRAWSLAEERSKEAKANLASVGAAAKKWDAQKAIIDSPVSGPSDEDLQAAEKSVADAAVVAKSSQAKEEVEAAELRARACGEEALAASNRAKMLRDIVAGLSGRLGEILSDNGLENMTVAGGRLVAKIGKQDVLFAERLSVGQRWRFALSLAVKAYNGWIPIDPAGWSALQPSVQKEIAGHARERGVYLVTEQPTDEEGVTVRHFP